MWLYVLNRWPLLQLDGWMFLNVEWMETNWTLDLPPDEYHSSVCEQPCRLLHKRHYEGRCDDVSKNLGHRNYQGIPTGNPWNQVVATPWPTETVLSRSLPPSLAESLCLVVVNDEELPVARVVALARLGWSSYSEPTDFPSLHGKIACWPSGKGLRLQMGDGKYRNGRRGLSPKRSSFRIPFSGISSSSAENLFYSNIDCCLEIQLYRMDHHIFFLRKFEGNWTTFARSNWYVNMAFIWRATREISEIYSSMTISVIPQILEIWQLCHNMLCGWQMSCSQNFGVIWAN